MSVVHFIYTLGNGLSHPDAVFREVSRRLAARHKVIGYHLLDRRPIRPGPDDILLGHPFPEPGTIYRRSVASHGWKRIVALHPYCGDAVLMGYADRFAACCDVILAITGRYWFSSIERSPFSHWRPKMTQVDLAVNRADFPVVKGRFSPPGHRRFVYIGHTGWYKNTGYLSQIASAMPGMVSWMGGSDPRSLPGTTPLGRQDFRTAEAKQLVSQHDFMLTVGCADPNPTTILEAMAWGLIPVCTPQSGYVDYPSIPNIPLNDLPGALKILKELQEMPEERLTEMRDENWHMLDTHFNWDRFSNQVLRAVEGTESPALGTESLRRKLAIRYASMTEPRSLIWPRNLARFAGRLLLKPIVRRLQRRRDNGGM